MLNKTKTNFFFFIEYTWLFKLQKKKTRRQTLSHPNINQAI